MPQATITAPAKPGMPATIHCPTPADMALAQGIPTGRTPVVVVQPAITLTPLVRTASPKKQVVRPTRQVATPAPVMVEEEFDAGTVTDYDQAKAFILAQPGLAHSIQTVIEDQRPAGLPARDEVGKTNRAYNSAVHLVQKARKHILKERGGGAFVPAPHKGKGWVRFQQ